MASLNRVDIIGNLGQEPELKYTQTGKPVCTLNVATNREWKDDTGKVHKEVSWHRVVVWGKQAENASKYLGKGDPVYVSGRMETRKYTDKDNIDRWVTEVVAQSVQFLKPAPSNRPPHPGEAAPSNGGPPGDDWDRPMGTPPPEDDGIAF